MSDKTSADYQSVVVLYPRGGQWKTNCLRQNIHDPQTAAQRLRSDLAAWVNPEDVEAVCAQLQGVTVGERS
jgi:hypothetical protein